MGARSIETPSVPSASATVRDIAAAAAEVFEFCCVRFSSVQFFHLCNSPAHQRPVRRPPQHQSQYEDEDENENEGDRIGFVP